MPRSPTESLMPRRKAKAADQIDALDRQKAAAELAALPRLLSKADERLLEAKKTKAAAAKFLSDMTPEIRGLSERGYPAPHIAQLLRRLLPAKSGVRVNGADITKLLEGETVSANKGEAKDEPAS